MIVYDHNVHTVAVPLCLRLIAMQIEISQESAGAQPLRALEASFPRRRESRTRFRMRKCYMIARFDWTPAFAGVTNAMLRAGITTEITTSLPS